MLGSPSDGTAAPTRNWLSTMCPSTELTVYPAGRVKTGVPSTKLNLSLKSLLELGRTGPEVVVG